MAAVSTSTLPAAKQPALSVKEFSDKVDFLEEAFTAITSHIRKFEKDGGKAKTIVMTNGKPLEINRGTLRSLCSDFKEELQSLKKDYTKGVKGKRGKGAKNTKPKDPTKARHGALAIPRLLRPEMQAFIRASNLGPVYNVAYNKDPAEPDNRKKWTIASKSETSPSLVAAVPNLCRGHATISGMTILFNLIVEKDSLRIPGNDGMIDITRDPNHGLLDTILTELELKSKVPNEEGEVNEFTRKQFPFCSLQKICGLALRDNEKLTPEEKASLTSEDVKRQVEAEGNLVRDAYAVAKEARLQRQAK